jgi:predicted ArsR family transcriptional regulator
METSMQKTKAKTAKGKPAKSMPEAKQRSGTKQHRLIEMLKRPQGATIAQLAKALHWQEHTVRGTMSAALKKRLGLTITSKAEEAGRVYRITGGASRPAP